MKLTELHPEFMQASDTGQKKGVEQTIESTDGIIFLCPKCTIDKNNGADIHVHSIVCWKSHVSQDHFPKPGRWNMEGDSFETLTLVNGSSSVALNGGCNAHFFIRSGEVIMC